LRHRVREPGRQHRSRVYDVTIAVTSNDTVYEHPVSLTVAAPGTFLAAYDNTGISDDSGGHDEADHDAGGWSYSRQAPASAGSLRASRAR
jgi:hypothetical protein